MSTKRISVPEKYPRVCAIDSPDPPVGREIDVSHIIPVKQTFPWLTQAVIFATHNVMLGVWNKGVMEAYLRTARSWIDTYCAVCMYVDLFLECARARGDVTVALQWRYMMLHGVTRRYTTLHDVT